MNDSRNEARQLLMRFAKEDLEQVTARAKVRYSVNSWRASLSQL